MASYAEKLIRSSYKKTAKPRMEVTNKGLRDMDKRIAQGLQENAEVRLESVPSAAGLSSKP
jgi:hypothetical protein